MSSLRVFQTYRRLLKRPAPLRVAFAVLFAVALAGLSRATVNLNIYGLRDEGVPSTAALARMRHSFDEGMSATFLIAPARPGARLTGRQLCGLRDFLSRPRGGLRLTSPFDLPAPMTGGTRLSYEPLLTPPCASDEPQNLARVFEGTPWVGLFTDRERQDLAIEATFTEVQSGAPWTDTYEKLARELRTATPVGFAVHPVGRASSQWYVQRSIRADLWVNLVLLLGIVVAFRAFFGTWLAGAIYGGTLAFTSIVIVGLMGLSGSSIDVLNNGLFVMTAVAAAEDFVFLSLHQFRRQRAGRSAFVALFAPSFWTSFTTMVGFASLLISPMHMIQRFGCWAAAAALVEWAAIFLLLPALAGRGTRLRWVRPERAFGLGLAGWVGRLSIPRAAGRVLLLLPVLGIIGYTRIGMDAGARIFPREHQLSQAADYLAQSRGWEAPVHVLFAPGSSANERRASLDRIRALPGVKMVVSRDVLVNHLTAALDPSVRRLAENELGVTPAFRAFASWDGTERATVFLEKINLASLIDSLARLRTACGTTCEPAGELVVAADFTDKIWRALSDSFLLSGVLVGLILAWLTRRLTLGMRALLLLTSTWGPLSLYGLIWVGHIQVDLMASMVGAVLVGITGDNAIQYVFASRRKNLGMGVARRSTGSAIVALVAAIGSLTLCLLSITPLRTLGWLLSGGFVLSFLGDLVLLRSELQTPPSTTALAPVTNEA